MKFTPSQERLRYLFYFGIILSQSNCKILSSTMSHEVIVGLVGILCEESQVKQKGEKLTLYGCGQACSGMPGLRFPQGQDNLEKLENVSF